MTSKVRRSAAEGKARWARASKLSSRTELHCQKVRETRNLERARPEHEIRSRCAHTTSNCIQPFYYECRPSGSEDCGLPRVAAAQHSTGGSAALSPGTCTSSNPSVRIARAAVERCNGRAACWLVRGRRNCSKGNRILRSGIHRRNAYKSGQSNEMLSTSSCGYDEFFFVGTILKSEHRVR